MAYGVGQVQQVPILSPQEHQQIAQENQARQLTLQAAVEKRNADIAQAQAKAQQDQFLQASVQKHMVDGKPDFDAVIRDAYQAYPDLAMSLEEQLSKHRSSLVDARKKELETEKLHMDLDLEAMKRMVDPNTFAAYRGRLSPEAQQAVGEQFDPERLALLMNKAPTETQRLDRLRLLLDKDTRRAMLEELDAAPTPEDAEQVWQGWSELFGPKDTAAIRQRIGDVSTPEGKARLQQLLAGEQKPGTAPNLGSFEDYVIRRFGQNPTPQQIEQARKSYNQADDRPTGGGGTPQLSPAMESQVLNRLTNQWAAAKKPAEEIQRQAALMKVGMEQARAGNMNAGSQAVIATFNKILDPNSVVRESEYDRTAAGQSMMARIRGAIEKLTKGGAGVGLPELENFYKLAEEAVKAQTSAYLRATKDRIGRTADHYKLPRDLVFEDVDVTTGAKAPAASELPKGKTFKATQDGVTYEITTDASGKVISQKVIK